MSEKTVNEIVLEDFETVGIHPACSPESRKKERDELQKLMDEWEAKNGPVITQPIGEFYSCTALSEGKKNTRKRIFNEEL